MEVKKIMALIKNKIHSVVSVYFFYKPKTLKITTVLDSPLGLTFN